MNAALSLSHRVLATFPPSLQAQIRAQAERGFDDIDDLVQDAALHLLAGAGFGSARSAGRRYTQDPAYYGRSLDGIADTLAAESAQPTRARKKREIAREITADFRVGKRRARQIVAAQLERAKQGDLFVHDEDEDGEDDDERKHHSPYQPA